MEKKKILVISNLYPSFKSPFYGSFVKNFIEQINLDAHVQSVDCVLLKGRHDNKLIKLLLYFRFYLLMFYRLIFFNYHLIYVHLITHSTLPIRLVNYFKKEIVIFNIHGEDLLVTTSLSRFLLRCAIPMLYQAKAIVVPSIYFSNILKAKLPLLDCRKILISPSAGVKSVFFMSPHEYCNRNHYVLGYVSRIDRGKGWDVLLRAIETLDRELISVLIVGGGLEVEYLREMILKHNLDNVKYIGPIAYDELPNFYSTLDLFIFPTMLRESLGLVGLEAMASGVPVVASKIGGIQDYLKDGVNGFFFEAGNSLDLATKINQFISLPIDRKNDMSRNAIVSAERYSSGNVAKELFDRIFNEII